ncbi:MFS transporter [Caldifermentibacillus hisashii]|uniref:MFS transporter n=1 Tax=Caldifermentibacillus hisashii TaxID=996558 RepID=UPI002DFB9CE5|nr:MFS transporter [Caldifermentibacillus hisashii]
MARMISGLGDWIFLIAMPLYIFDITKSTIATGSMFIIQMLPRLLFGSIAGTFVDKRNKKWTLVIVDVVRAVALALLFFVPSGQLWAFLVIAFIQNLVGTLFIPAHRSLLVATISRERLVVANSITVVSDNIIRIIGPSIGGALLGIAGVEIAIATEIFSYMISSVLLSLVAVKSSQQKGVETSLKQKWLEFWGNWWNGLKVVGTNQLYSTIFLMFSFIWLAQGMINVLFVPYVINEMGQTSVEFGWIESVQGIGGLIGGYLLLKLNKKVAPFPLIISSLLASGGFALLQFNIPILFFVFIMNAFLGITDVISSVRLETLLQEQVPENYMGRIFGAYNTLMALTMLIGMSIASFLGEMMGTVMLLNISALLFFLTGIVGYRALKQNMKVSRHGKND